MSEYHEVIEEDKAYLEEVGMRSLLQQFVADAMEDHPENVYEYMASWAAKKGAEQAVQSGDGAQQPVDAYPTEGSPKGAAHSADEASQPDAALRRHEDSFNVGHPSKEAPASTSHVSDPHASQKIINEVAHAIENDEEL